MADPSSLATAIPLESFTLPLVEAIVPWIKLSSLLLGGTFGVYVILLFVRTYYERKKYKELQAMREDIRVLRLHIAPDYRAPKPKKWYQFTSSPTKESPVHEQVETELTKRKQKRKSRKRKK